MLTKLSKLQKNTRRQRRQWPGMAWADSGRRTPRTGKKNLLKV